MKVGALEPITTKGQYVDDSGVCFVVRVAANLRKKAHAAQDRGGARPDNPFLPYDEDLFVAEIADTHVALLNKYSVVDHHLLIVTRSFEEQDSTLTLRDFEALLICMAEYRALGFYNSGAIAGASQRHRHLQMVPLPISAAGPGCPIDTLVGALEPAGKPITVAGIPFGHRFMRFGAEAMDDPVGFAARRYASYLELLDAAGLRQREPAAYNLLLTREWMMLVPRVRECCHGISINALGFAGSLFVKTSAQFEQVRNLGPMAMLASVAAGRDDGPG